MANDGLSQAPYYPDTMQRSRVNKTLTDQFVVANGYGSSTQKALRPTNDEVEIEVSLRTYERMENDSAIAKCKKILVTSVLADDLQFSPGATEDEVGPDEYKTYVQVMKFCERVMKGLDKPIRTTLEQLLGNSLRHGHGIGEIEWDYRTDAPDTEPEEDKSQPNTKVASMWSRLGVWFSDRFHVGAAEQTGRIKRPVLKGAKTRLMPVSIMVKPRGAVRFVVDEYMNELGLVPKFKNYKKLNYDEILDRDKFVVLTNNKCDEDPRGRSAYRPAYNWYNLKTQLPAEILRFILEEAVPKAVGVLPPESAGYEYERDANDNIIYEADGVTPKMLTLAESFQRQIENFRSGSGAVIPNGAELKPFKGSGDSSGDARLFTLILKIINDEIENAILLQTLAQSEGAHQARSASEQVALVLNNLVFWTRWAICAMIWRDICSVAVRINLGEWALRYMPQVSLGDFVRRDWNSDLSAIADAYFKGFLDDSQRAELMAWLNLPKPGQSRQEQTAAQQDVNGEPAPQNQNRPDKQAGTKNRNAGNGTEKKTNADENYGLSPLYGMGHHKGRSGGFKGNL